MVRRDQQVAHQRLSLLRNRVQQQSLSAFFQIAGDQHRPRFSADAQHAIALVVAQTGSARSRIGKQDVEAHTVDLPAIAGRTPCGPRALGRPQQAFSVGVQQATHRQSGHDAGGTSAVVDVVVADHQLIESGDAKCSQLRNHRPLARVVVAKRRTGIEQQIACGGLHQHRLALTHVQHGESDAARLRSRWRAGQ